MPAALVPGKRGSRCVFCRGTFLFMRGHYGWIQPAQTIDHPAADLRQGRVYLGLGDVRRGALLEPGCEVDFFLYADADGLGAEDCHPSAECAAVESLARAMRSSRRRLEQTRTSKIQPRTSAAVTLVPPQAVEAWLTGHGASLREGRVCRDALVPNFAGLLDASDAEDSAEEGLWASVAARCAQVMGDASTTGDAVESCMWPSPEGREFSKFSDASTSAGESSDEAGHALPPALVASDGDSDDGGQETSRAVHTSHNPGHHQLRGAFRPPPGLELPPPPGLA